MSYGLQMSKLVTCLTCEKLLHRQRPKSCITVALTLIGLRRSAVNPTIDQLPDRAVLTLSRYFDVFGPVSVLDNTSFFHVPWGLLTMCLQFLDCQFPSPDQSATTAAMPCSSVSRGEYTLTRDQV